MNMYYILKKITSHNVNKGVKVITLLTYSLTLIYNQEEHFERRKEILIKKTKFIKANKMFYSAHSKSVFCALG